MAVAVAGLVSTTSAQAQTYKYGPSGINPSHVVWLQITGTQVEIRGDFRGWGGDSGGAYSGTINTSIPTVAGVSNALNFGVKNPEINDSQAVVGWVSSTQFHINQGNSPWTLNLESGTPANNPPTVGITAPSGGATYTAPATVNIPVTVTAALPGLKGTYFNNVTLTGDPVLTRTDGTVDFAWGGTPDPALPAGNFSVRWTGSVLADYSGTYTFYVTGDDGVRLWVNSQQLVDQWKDQGATEYSGTIDLSAGQKYDVKLEYYQSGGGAEARLKWSHASVPKAVIPQDHLVLGP
jgi:hypothetical protein